MLFMKHYKYNLLKVVLVNSLKREIYLEGLLGGKKVCLLPGETDYNCP
jgi:hypothetical protein